MEEVKTWRELKVKNLPVPTTSKVAPGEAVWIPTFEEEFTMKAGVALDNVWSVLLLNRRAETPVSTTKFPVVCTLTRSDAEDPLNINNS